MPWMQAFHSLFQPVIDFDMLLVTDCKMHLCFFCTQNVNFCMCHTNHVNEAQIFKPVEWLSHRFCRCCLSFYVQHLSVLPFLVSATYWISNGFLTLVPSTLVMLVILEGTDRLCVPLYITNFPYKVLKMKGSLSGHGTLNFISEQLQESVRDSQDLVAMWTLHRERTAARCLPILQSPFADCRKVTEPRLDINL